MKFTFSGYICVKITYVNIKNIKFDITDTGIGIKKEDLHKLFNVFEKIDHGESNHINS